MLYKVRVILNTSDKNDVFRDIEIRANQTLWNLHQGIRSAFNFKTEELASFYYCDKDWNQENEIPLEDMTDDRSGETMSDIYLKEALPKVGAKLLYVYDFMDMWSFFIELIEIGDNKPSINYPLTSYRFGTLPLKSPNQGFSAPAFKDEFHNEFGEVVGFPLDDDLNALDPDLDIDDVTNFDDDLY